MFSRRISPWFQASLLTALGVAFAPACHAGLDFQITPATVTLDGNFARAQLVVREREKGGVNEQSADRTHQARYVSSDPRIVTVSDTGLLLAQGNGSATITVSVDGVAHVVAVNVKGVVSRPRIAFKEHVIPVLAKAGCNAGACHASQFGKGGFKLSVFSFAPEDDYRAIVRDSFGRRANTITPSASLLLRKPTGAVPHEGGQRLQAGSVDYQILEQWLAGGAAAALGEGGEGDIAARLAPTARRLAGIHAAIASPGDLR